MPFLKERLTEILIKNKLITPEQLNQALQVQKNKGGRLSNIIVGLGFIKESDLVFALSEGLGLPPWSHHPLRPEFSFGTWNSCSTDRAVGW